MNNGHWSHFFDELGSKYPRITIIQTEKNLGYGQGNNLGVRQAQGAIFVFLNPDTTVEAGWLEELIRPIVYDKTKVTTPRILDYSHKKTTTCGTLLHFSGLSFVNGLDGSWDNIVSARAIQGVSGCCFAIHRSFFETLGGFDGRFFLYNEDSDLSWSIHLHDGSIWYIPRSVLCHDYHPGITPQKLYHLEKGRFIILKKNYSFKDCIILLPSLILVESMIFVYCIIRGKSYLIFKIASIRDVMKSDIITDSRKNKKNLIANLNASIHCSGYEELLVNKSLLNSLNFFFGINFFIYTGIYNLMIKKKQRLRLRS